MDFSGLVLFFRDLAHEKIAGSTKDVVKTVAADDKRRILVSRRKDAIQTRISDGRTETTHRTRADRHRIRKFSTGGNNTFNGVEGTDWVDFSRSSMDLQYRPKIFKSFLQLCDRTWLP